MTSLPGYSGGRPVPADRLSRSSAKKCPVPSDGLCPESRPFSFRLPSNELPPFAQRQGFWHPTPPANQAAGHPGFLLQTVTSFLRPGLRHYYGFICHLAPLRSTLSLLLNLTIRETLRNDTRLPQLLRAPCKLPHPQSLKGSDQVSGFALSCTLTHQLSRIRFTCAMCSLLPIASFRPCRRQQRPCESDCLPPGRGDACFFQQAGFARYAGQTKKGE